jgi:hypothetical protein
MTIETTITKIKLPLHLNTISQMWKNAKEQVLTLPNLIFYINSLGLSTCLFEPVHSDPLSVFVRPIPQPPDDRNEVSIPTHYQSLRGWFCNPRMTETRSRNEPHLAWNVPAPGAGRGGEADSATPQMTIYQFFASAAKKFTIAGLKCSSARCGSWWWGRFCNALVKNKHFIFIIQNKNRKHIKI